MEALRYRVIMALAKLLKCKAIIDQQHYDRIVITKLSHSKQYKVPDVDAINNHYKELGLAKGNVLAWNYLQMSNDIRESHKRQMEANSKALLALRTEIAEYKLSKLLSDEFPKPGN